MWVLAPIPWGISIHKIGDAGNALLLPGTEMLKGFPGREITVKASSVKEPR